MARARRLLALLALAGVAAVPAVPRTGVVAPDAAVVAAGCATDLAGAAALVSDRVVATPVPSRAVGVDVVVVTDPLIAPGVPHAVLDTALGLCTTDTFNLTVAPTLDGPAAVAAAFASTAAMPWLGAVEVTDVRVQGDTVALTTFGGRHNVTSEWTVTVDRSGVRDATFETVAFGTGLEVDDIHALEGVTSRPGHTRTWTRDALGVLHVDATLEDLLAASIAERDAATVAAAEAAGLAPGDLLEGELDGQVVRFTLGFVAPLVELPTVGSPEDDLVADRLVYVRDGMDLIYDQLESWGTPDVWDSGARTLLGFPTVPDEVGYVNYNSPLAVVCLACAVLGDFIEIHMDLFFAETTEEVLIGVDYPHNNSYTLEVVGHEFTHAVQGGYGNGSVGLTNAFYEATATASQTLFHEAENSAQRGSIEFLDNGNGCEGFENGRGGWLAAQANGPFLEGHTYDACYFWWTYMARHGGDGLVALMETLPGLKGQGSSNIDRHLMMLDRAAASGDGTEDLAYWAAAYTAGTDGDGYKITDGSGDVHDWFALLTPAERARDLAAGAALPFSGKNGGTAGFRVTTGGTLTSLPAGAEAFVYELVEGSIRLVGPASVGTAVTAGQLLAVVAPTPATVSGQVAIS